MALTMYRVIYTTKEGDKAVRVWATLPTDAWAAVQTAFPTGVGKHNGALQMVTVQQMMGNADILVGS